MARYFFDHALLPDGWASDVLIEVTSSGEIASTQCGARQRASDASIDGRFAIGLPGLINAHSHAFQRAMAGLAEFRGPARDTFWSWRDVMYRFAAALTPDDQQAMAAYLHLELLKHGYTALVEFHYLHNRPDGGVYDDPAAMSLATLEAARESGIGLTHLPVLYMSGGFDGAPLTDRQKRFGLDIDGLGRIAEDVRIAAESAPELAAGLAAHSLRAVPASELDTLLGLRETTAFAPFHIHVAEQAREVEDCQKHYGLRPIEWLLANTPVDESWTLVHATHISPAECAALARRGATVALCPTTEANLGDGIFPLPEFCEAGGAVAVGSDSHVCVSPWEELRWLEYGQRLQRQERNIMASPEASTGTTLLQHFSRSAPQATGRAVGRLAPGFRADIIVLDDSPPQLEGRIRDSLVDTVIFATSTNPVRHVMVGGRWRIRDGRHESEPMLAERYRRVMGRLAEDV